MSCLTSTDHSHHFIANKFSAQHWQNTKKKHVQHFSPFPFCACQWERTNGLNAIAKQITLTYGQELKAETERKSKIGKEEEGRE